MKAKKELSPEQKKQILDIITDDDMPPPPQYVPQPTTQPDTNNEPVDYAKRTTRWKKWKLSRAKHKTEAWLINMELSNGKHISMIMFSTEDSYIWKGRRYLIDAALCYYHLSSGLYALDYHEEISIPIRRKVDPNEIKKAIRASRTLEEENLLNPQLLQNWKKSRLHEMVLRGGQIDAFLRQVRLLLWIVLVIGTLHLIIFVVKSGMLSKLKIPGMG